MAEEWHSFAVLLLCRENSLERAPAAGSVQRGTVDRKKRLAVALDTERSRAFPRCSSADAALAVRWVVCAFGRGRELAYARVRVTSSEPGEPRAGAESGGDQRKGDEGADADHVHEVERDGAGKSELAGGFGHEQLMTIAFESTRHEVAGEPRS